jgi:small acid-soluble spore protein I (minor)
MSININLRQAVIQRVQNKSMDELHEVIDDSIGGEDRVLPGLGVLFEIMWENSDQQIQDGLIKTLQDHLH